MAEHKIRIARRDFPLVFTLGALEKLDKFIPEFDITKVDQYLYNVSGLLDVLYILAEEGAILNGQKLDVDREWFGSHMKASKKQITDLHVAIVDTLVDGMTMETDEEDENREVDVVLEEIKKKETTTD